MACDCISKKVAKVSIWISLIILVLSIVILALFPTIYNSVLKNDITLTEGSVATSVWSDIPIPIHERLYFFNITNRKEFLNGEEPLNVTEVGPYTYKSRWAKKISWNSNFTVSYRETRTFHFVQNLSNGTEEDEIYSLNGPLIIASNIAEAYGEDERAILSVLLSIEGEEIIIKKKIRELVYEGYDDIIIKYAPIFKPEVPYKDGKFSWLYGKNGTDDGEFTVFTGADDLSKTDIINNWNGEERLSFWKGDSCNMLNGTSVETGPPIEGEQETYTFFQSILCRSLTFKYTEDKVYYDIPSKRFRPTYELFANSTVNPENQCFEVKKERPSGVLDLSPCQFGSPLLLSFPHFYFADSSYLNAANGLSPNDEEHGSYLDIEPTTGLTIGAIIRIQFNIELSKVTGIFQTYKPSKGILPLFWAELNLQIDESLADFLKSKLRNPKIIAYSVLGVLLFVSLGIALVCIIVLRSKERNEEDDKLLDAKESYSYYNGKSVNSTDNCAEDVRKNHEKAKNSSEYTTEESSNDKTESAPDKILSI